MKRKLKNKITIQKLLKVFDTNTSLFLNNFIGLDKYFKKNKKVNGSNYFFQNRQQIYESTNISPSTQSRIIKRLKDMDIIEVKRKGFDPRNWYKINYSVLKKMIKKG